RDWPTFWERMRRHEIGPSFGYSGYVITVVTEFVHERGITLLASGAVPGMETLAAEGSVVVCVSPVEAAAVRRSIAGLAVDDAELATYWENWVEESDTESSQFMRSGLDWLHDVLQAGVKHEWTLVWVG